MQYVVELLDIEPVGLEVCEHGCFLRGQALGRIDQTATITARTRRDLDHQPDAETGPLGLLRAQLKRSRPGRSRRAHARNDTPRREGAPVDIKLAATPRRDGPGIATGPSEDWRRHVSARAEQNPNALLGFTGCSRRKEPSRSADLRRPLDPRSAVRRTWRETAWRGWRPPDAQAAAEKADAWSARNLPRVVAGWPVIRSTVSVTSAAFGSRINAPSSSRCSTNHAGRPIASSA